MTTVGWALVGVWMIVSALWAINALYWFLRWRRVDRAYQAHLAATLRQLEEVRAWTTRAQAWVAAGQIQTAHSSQDQTHIDRRLM
jgi:hypothetical protein